MQTERVCLHSQTLTIIAAFLFGFLQRFLWHFAIAKFFFGALYNISATIGLSWFSNVQVNHIKHLFTLDLLFWCDIASDESVTKSLWLKQLFFKAFFYLSCLSSIHEKANCMAIFWTGRPHSLGSCHFRSVWTTCLPHKGGASRWVPCPRTQQANLLACSFDMS